MVGGAALIESVSGAAIEKLHKHHADAFLGIADRMPVVADDDVTAAAHVTDRKKPAARRSPPRMVRPDSTVLVMPRSSPLTSLTCAPRRCSGLA